MTSETDTNLGQLVVARGLLDLPTLMQCVAQSGAGQMRLSDVLVDQGYLSSADLDQLQGHLATADQSALQDEFDQGDTLVLGEIYSTQGSLSTAAPASEGVAETLAKPPSQDGGRAITPAQAEGAPDLPRLDLVREARYEFRDELGRGGMGQVMLAYDQILNRDIALKTLLPEASDHSDTRERLLQEAQITGILEHPSIIPIYDLGALSNHQPFYTMRVVRERSLDQIIREMATDEEHNHSVNQMVSILKQVSLAVHYAHDFGVIHRDLKPENILIGSYGEVFVIDWGVAKVVDPELRAMSLSRPETEEIGALVGTPQYMSPEQAQGQNDRVDERTDVYALGAILYEVLTLEPVFRAKNILSLLFKAVEEAPVPPSERTPERTIPRELEDICLKALAKSPDDRFQSAEEMADELDLFLEGVKERERRHQMALTSVRDADEVRTEYQAAKQRHSDALQKVTHEKLNVESWAPQSEKEHIWELEQRVEDLQVEIERQFSDATRLYGQALSQQPEMPEAREALADLYWERFRESERAGERARAAYFEGLVRQYNDGTYDQLLDGKATLSVVSTPEPAKATLYEFVEVNRRLVQRKVADLGDTPIKGRKVQHGNYLLHLQRDGYVPLRIPILLDRLDDRLLEPRMYREDEVPDCFLVVSDGEFLSGELQAQTGRAQTQDLPDFAIMRNPVTCADYLEFLNEVAADDLQKARSHSPRVEDGESYFPVENGRFSLPVDDADGDSWNRDWPICMISYFDAVAYAKWRGQRDGLGYRLPTSKEWEKAARGVDGRIYPWGNHFDPSFCRMRDSERGRPMPVPIGSYELDCSPYGARHMAGNVVEWTATATSPDSNRRIVQGGSYNSIPLMCKLDWHMDVLEDAGVALLGFRLAMTL
jgi:serine/threonine-protein kinase